MGTNESYCPGCFHEKGTAPLCPACGYDERSRISPIALPPRSLLRDNYLVGRVLGRPGGFGITYLGYDLSLETRVAIKEYLPRDMAGRDDDHRTVVLHSQDDTESFTYGLEQFLKEARTLAKFNHPRVVRVRTFFQENGTAYLVMDYIEGISLAEFLERLDRPLTEQQALDMMMPILDGVGVVHSQGFLHRDIKPQNIYLTAARQPILLDFGAARLAMGEKSRSLSVILTPGFAPYEQYHRRGEQGPWTDIYACAATLYYMVTRQVPPDALEREKGDTLMPPDTTQPGLSPHFCRAILRALATEPASRPRSIAEFQSQLRGLTVAPAAESDPTLAIPAPAKVSGSVADTGSSVTLAIAPPPPAKIRRSWVPLAAGIAAAALLAVAAVIGYWMFQPAPDDSGQSTTPVVASPAAGSQPVAPAAGADAKPAPPPPDASATADPIRPATPSTNRTPDMTAKASAPVTAPTGSPTQPAAPPPVTPATDTAPAPATASAQREPLRLSEPELRARLREYSPPPHVRQRIRSLTRFVKISCLIPIELLVDETGAVARATPQPSSCPPNVALIYTEMTRYWRFEPTRTPDGGAVPVIGIVHIPFPPLEKDGPDGARSLPRR
ncbi:MAG TPA: protein kinase [Acidobacteriota bacterium]|nr:protein kinase [Acidobacteriota bacterium]HQM63147.1 protein kinase [Acidobacteriota bacterium]